MTKPSTNRAAARARQRDRERHAGADRQEQHRVSAHHDHVAMAEIHHRGGAVADGHRQRDQGVTACRVAMPLITSCDRIMSTGASPSGQSVLALPAAPGSLSRHCERSEAIQTALWIASSLRSSQ